jgi:hypothetical protein
MQIYDLEIGVPGPGERFAAFQEGPWLQPGGINVPALQLEALERQKTSEWDRWRAHGARHDWPRGRHNVNATSSDDPTSTSLENSRIQFKQLLDHSCSSSNIQENRQQQEQRAREDEAVTHHRSPGWPALFGSAPDHHITAQVITRLRLPSPLSDGAGCDVNLEHDDVIDCRDMPSGVGRFQSRMQRRQARGRSCKSKPPLARDRTWTGSRTVLRLCHFTLTARVGTVRRPRLGTTACRTSTTPLRARLYNRRRGTASP